MPTPRKSNRTAPAAAAAPTPSPAGSGSASTTAASGSPPPPPPGNGPPAAEIVEAIKALTAFLHHGSQQPDPQAFSRPQRNIESDFVDLVAGLGRGPATVRPRRLGPARLYAGYLELDVPLPADADTIGGYAVLRASAAGPARVQEVWLIKVADAVTSGDRAKLRHQDIVTTGVVRLRVFDASGRRILFGIPTFPQSPSLRSRRP
jgi:hypothetical protein